MGGVNEFKTKKMVSIPVSYGDTIANRKLKNPSTLFEFRARNYGAWGTPKQDDPARLKLLANSIPSRTSITEIALILFLIWFFCSVI